MAGLGEWLNTNVYGAQVKSQGDPQYGGRINGANNEALRYRDLGTAASTRQGPKIDTSSYAGDQANVDQSRSNLADAMTSADQHSMYADSAASRQMQQGLNDSIAAQYAQAHSAQGNGSAQAAAQRQAAFTGANMAQRNVNDSAALRANEAATYRSQAIQQATAQRQADLQKLGMSMDQAQQQAQLEMSQRGLNDQTALGYEGLGFNVNNAQLQAATAANHEHNAANIANAQMNAQAGSQMLGGLLSLGGTIGGAMLGGPAGAMAGGAAGGALGRAASGGGGNSAASQMGTEAGNMASDERSKEGIVSLSRRAKGQLEPAHAEGMASRDFTGHPVYDLREGSGSGGEMLARMWDKAGSAGRLFRGMGGDETAMTKSDERSKAGVSSLAEHYIKSPIEAKRDIAALRSDERALAAPGRMSYVPGHGWVMVPGYTPGSPRANAPKIEAVVVKPPPDDHEDLLTAMRKSAAGARPWTDKGAPTRDEDEGQRRDSEALLELEESQPGISGRFVGAERLGHKVGEWAESMPATPSEFDPIDAARRDGVRPAAVAEVPSIWDAYREKPTKSDERSKSGAKELWSSFTKSDEKSKSSRKGLADHLADEGGMRGALGALEPYSFEYKDPADGVGRRAGIMAQDALKNPVSAHMVEEMPDGMLALDRKKAEGFTLAAVADLDKRLRSVEDAKRRVR